MAENDAAELKPLWLSIEEQILGLDAQGLAGENLEATVQQIAGALDKAGYQVSKYGGKMLDLRSAVDAAQKVGKPLLQDVNGVIGAFTLADVVDPYAATDKLIAGIRQTWPDFANAKSRPDVIQLVEQARLDLLIAEAKGMAGDEGIRYLIEKGVTDEVITAALDLTEEQLAEVHAQIAAELAERARVADLLGKVEGKPDQERIKSLFDNNVAEELIIEMASVDQAAIDATKKAMEEELKEKERLAAEAAAKKKAEAEGPSLDDIPADQMIDHIDAIREIMEFSDQEKEIRTMCEQSAIPKSLVDIAVTEPDKLDELEKKAEG
ncbi:MAG: hypothetical protein GY697_01430 [Desulfobacterales bacterium]|nr:hypothetical protein [Desulfobacterales bacterium]